MRRKPRRVALMLDLRWPYKRHSEIFAGVQRYAEEQGWESIIDEFAHDTLRRERTESERYDGIVARANPALARRAAELGVPVVNVWPSSPARHLLPGVFPDSTETGRLVAEHLLARGFRTFATLTSPQNADPNSLTDSDPVSKRRIPMMRNDLRCRCRLSFQFRSILLPPPAKVAKLPKRLKSKTVTRPKGSPPPRPTRRTCRRRADTPSGYSGSESGR